MQNWALQQVLKRNGHDPVTINRHTYKPPLNNRRRLAYTIICAKTIINKFLKGKDNTYVSFPLSRNFTNEVSVAQFHKKFTNRNICLSNPIYTTKELSHYLDQSSFDAIIIGSDQVWREEYSPAITEYFLEWDTEYNNYITIAYAASFGISKNYISPYNLIKCKGLIHKFSSISVREDSGLEILKKQFKVNATKVLDPTLLLSKDDYISLLKIKPKYNTSILTSYILDNNSDKQAITSQTADSLNLTVTNLSLQPNNRSNRIKSILYWLNKIASSQFIVTDSYHGCVFSIIFEKPFIAISNNERGLDRFLSLLNDIGLKHRLVNSTEQYLKNKSHLIQPIDYKPVYQKLETLRNNSICYLRNALTNNINNSTDI